MPVGQCGKCSYPLDDDELGKRACPACGALLRDRVPFQAPGRHLPAPAAPPPRRSLLWPLAGMAFLAVASFGAGVYVMHSAEGRPETPSGGVRASAPEIVPP